MSKVKIISSGIKSLTNKGFNKSLSLIEKYLQSKAFPKEEEHEDDYFVLLNKQISNVIKLMTGEKVHAI